MKYASVKKRLLSVIIDSIIMGVIFSTARLFLPSDFAKYIYLRSAFPILTVLYYVVFLTYYSATPGKLLLKITIAKLDGNKIGLKEAILRNIVEILQSIIIVTAFFLAYDSGLINAYLIAEGNEKRQMIKDMNPQWQWNLGIITSAYGFFDVFIALTNPKRQALHDMIAKTIVLQQ